jgi:hypothetical protein
MIKSRMMSWVEHVAHMKMRNTYVRDHLGGLGVDGYNIKINLKRNRV